MTNLALICLTAGTLAACSVPTGTPVIEKASAVTETTSSTRNDIRTVKPGADVQIRSDLREPVAPGGSGALNVSFTEQYRMGNMHVRATPSEGLELITTIDEADFDMTLGDIHDWTVYFSAPEAGKHYINFSVKVDTPLGPQTRSSAAIIQVGKPGEGTVASKSSVTVETDAEGKPVIMMQAEETILQDD